LKRPECDDLDRVSAATLYHLPTFCGFFFPHRLLRRHNPSPQ